MKVDKLFNDKEEGQKVKNFFDECKKKLDKPVIIDRFKLKTP